MSSPDKQKRRVTVYVSEETYEQLMSISLKDERSISKTSERIIEAGLLNVATQSMPLHSTPQHSNTFHSNVVHVDPLKNDAKIDSDKPDIITVLENLPDEKLQNLALRLSKFLDRHVVIQSDTPQHGTPQSDPLCSNSIQYEKPLKTIVDVKGGQDLAIRLEKFVKENNLTRRSFQEKFNINISHLTSWRTGERRITDELYHRIESVLSNN